MVTEVLWGVLLPFFGTSLGAACVFFLHKLPGDGLQRVNFLLQTVHFL